MERPRSRQAREREMILQERRNEQDRGPGVALPEALDEVLSIAIRQQAVDDEQIHPAIPQQRFRVLQTGDLQDFVARVETGGHHPPEVHIVIDHQESGHETLRRNQRAGNSRAPG